MIYAAGRGSGVNLKWMSAMGVNSYLFDVIATHCGNWGGGGHLLVAGYPDFLVDEATLTRHLGRADFPADPRSDSLKWQHGEPQLDYCRAPEPVFAALGYPRMHVIDIRKDVGYETLVDLNYPADLGDYDLVLDHGTIEHCFNIAQAAKNLAEAVVEGGFIVQHLPTTIQDHGFYNLNRTWFEDFYSIENGFEMVQLETWSWPRKAVITTNPIPPYSLITCVAQRVSKIKIDWPWQRIYK